MQRFDREFQIGLHGCTSVIQCLRAAFVQTLKKSLEAGHGETEFIALEAVVLP